MSLGGGEDSGSSAVVSYQQNPFDAFFQDLDKARGDKPLTLDMCIKLLDEKKFNKIEEGKSLPEKLVKIIEEGAKGSAKAASQRIADAVKDSKLFALAKEEQQLIIEKNSTSWQKAAAFGKYLIGLAKRFANEFCQVTGITTRAITRKLVKYSTTAMQETIKAGQFTPGSLVANFSGHFLKAIATDPDVSTLGEKFVKFFTTKVEEQKDEIEKRSAEAGGAPTVPDAAPMVPGGAATV
jgi:hypothetical protein